MFLVSDMSIPEDIDEQLSMSSFHSGSAKVRHLLFKVSSGGNRGMEKKTFGKNAVVIFHSIGQNKHLFRFPVENTLSEQFSVEMFSTFCSLVPDQGNFLYVVKPKWKSCGLKWNRL